MIVRELVTKIGFNVDQNKLNKAEASFKGLVKSAGAMASSFVGVGAIVATAFAAIGGALFATVKSFTNAGDAALETSQKIGVNVESYQRLAYAAQFSGLSQEGLATSLKFLSKNLVDAAEGGKETGESFKKLGLDPKKYLNDTEGALIAISDKIAAMPDGAQKTALSMKLLGKSGADAIPFLNEGGEAIKKYGTEAERMGLIISEDVAKQADAFNDNLGFMGRALAGLKNTIGGALLPIFGDVVQKMVDWYKVNVLFIRANITKVFSKIGEIIKRLEPSLIRLKDAVLRLFGGGDVTSGMDGFIGILEGMANWLQILIGLWTGVTNALIYFKESFVGKALIEMFIDPLVLGLKFIMLLLDDLAAYFRGDNSVTGEMINAAGMIVDEWITLFSSLFEYLRMKFLETIDLAKGLINPATALGTIKDVVTGESSAASDMQLQKVQEAFNRVRNRSVNSLTSGGDFFGVGQQTIDNIRNKSPLIPNNAGALGSAVGAGGNTTKTENKNIKATGNFSINLPASSLADEVGRIVKSSFEGMLRQANNANSATAV